MKEFLRRHLSRLLAALLHANSRPFRFAPGRVMIVAPHADDETLGCGGLIAERSRRSLPLEVVFLTDSAGLETSGRDAPTRRLEALAALRELGVAPSSVHFLNAPDGRLSRSGSAECAAAQARLTRLIRENRPAEIFVPYWGGGSTEHDAAHWMVREALTVAGERTVIWEYPVWAWWNRLRLRRQLLRPEENFRHELGGLRAAKLRALARHRSQLAGLPPTLVELCTAPVEFYFRR